jgi:hypothetical protein
MGVLRSFRNMWSWCRFRCQEYFSQSESQSSNGPYKRFDTGKDYQESDWRNIPRYVH